MNQEISSNFRFDPCGKSISRTYPVLPIENFRLLYILPRNEMSQYLIIWLVFVGDITRANNVVSLVVV